MTVNVLAICMRHIASVLKDEQNAYLMPDAAAGDRGAIHFLAGCAMWGAVTELERAERRDEAPRLSWFVRQVRTATKPTPPGGRV